MGEPSGGYAEEVERALAVEAPQALASQEGVSEQGVGDLAGPKSGARSDPSLIVIGRRRIDPALEDRATNTVSAKQVRERVARSTPEALGDEVGAYVQQTAHGQGSVYLRGRTGRHTLLMVDGFRLNHALFRQGPNQYLFTIDPLSIERIEVLRGGGAVSLGANALAGAVLVSGTRPQVDSTLQGLHGSAALSALYASADLSRGLRAEGQAQLGSSWGLYLSGGWLKREPLEAAGALPIPDGTPDVLVLEKKVPRFEEDGRIQMGTGYRALSGDVVSRLKLSEGEWLVAARLYRQFDTPRTDQCPPPEAPSTWCLNYDEQFRTHVYSTLSMSPRSGVADSIWLGLSFQRQHERRSNDRENYLHVGRDAVNVFEARARARSTLWRGGGGDLQLRYGVDGTVERVTSKAWDTLVRSEITRERSRGQYLDGSQYVRGEGWSQLVWRSDSFSLRGGARATYTAAEAPADPESDTLGISRDWRGLALGGGAAWTFARGLTLLLNIEEGFAPPNLDDLTARQLTGQGYQIENPQLDSERALTYELGFRGERDWRWFGGKRGALSVENWVFVMQLKDGIERRDASCPPSERSCVAARVSTPFTLVNLSGDAWMYGFEHQLSLHLPASITLSEHIAYAHGEGPSPLPSEAGQTRPLSRVPPLNGSARIRWDSPERVFYAQLGVRWALAQSRLSFGDEIDHRIPYGGTPAYHVYHAQLGVRASGWELNLALENLSDEVYRIHGSSVNGAGRGASLFATYQL